MKLSRGDGVAGGVGTDVGGRRPFAGDTESHQYLPPTDP